MANLVVTYILWFFGGCWGLHHFYLGRDRHAFIWWSTWGGLFGLGWVRDLWRIPQYVYAENRDPGYMNEFRARANSYKQPPFSVVRFGGELIVGFMFGILLRLTIPEDFVDTTLGHILAIIVPPFGAAVGKRPVSHIHIYF